MRRLKQLIISITLISVLLLIYSFVINSLVTIYITFGIVGIDLILCFFYLFIEKNSSEYYEKDAPKNRICPWCGEPILFFQQEQTLNILLFPNRWDVEWKLYNVHKQCVMEIKLIRLQILLTGEANYIFSQHISDEMKKKAYGVEKK
jgi:hypothetical protein